MCGIFGIVNLDGSPAERAALQAMARVSVHRGPDDEGFHIDGACGIGMRRLSIIDLAGGHQPLSNSDASLVVVCNGEIYNFRELRRELEARGHCFATGSDSEVLLHGYAQWGDEVVQRLNGMFGFALWDARRRRLVIGRDRLGIKPLYLYRDAKRLAFASEAKALLALPGVQAAIEPSALHPYLNLGYVPAPAFAFQGHHASLPPATLLTIERGRIEQTRYWRIPHTVEREVAEGEWIERVRARLDESVRMQMVSDVPIGAFLSGGIDSSAVVGLMARHSARPIRTYSIGFAGAAAEQLLQRAALRAPRGAAFRHRPPRDPGAPGRRGAAAASPLAHGRADRRQRLHHDLPRVRVRPPRRDRDPVRRRRRRALRRLSALPRRPLPGLLRPPAVLAAPHRYGRRATLPSDRHRPLLNFSRLAKGFLENAALPFEERYRAYVEVFPRDEAERLLCGEGGAGADRIAEAFLDAPGEDGLNRMLSVDAQTQLPDDLLLLTDKMSMAASLECRVPLLDHELVELAARMPQAIKIRGGRLKHVMKEAVCGPAARRHPRAQEARLRHADGRLAQA